MHIGKIDLDKYADFVISLFEDASQSCIGVSSLQSSS